MIKSDIKELTSEINSVRRTKFRVREGAGFRQRLVAGTAEKLEGCGNDIVGAINEMFYAYNIDASADYIGFMQERDDIQLGISLSVGGEEKDVFNLPVPIYDETASKRVYDEKAFEEARDAIVQAVDTITVQRGEYKRNLILTPEYIENSASKRALMYHHRDKDTIDMSCMELNVINVGGNGYGL